MADAEAYDPVLATLAARVLATEDVASLQLHTAQGEAVTNANRQTYLQARLYNELYAQRRPAIDALRSAWAAVPALSQALATLHPTELMVCHSLHSRS